MINNNSSNSENNNKNNSDNNSRKGPDDVVVVSALRTALTKSKTGGFKDTFAEDAQKKEKKIRNIKK